jgi:hypothetical protein
MEAVSFAPASNKAVGFIEEGIEQWGQQKWLQVLLKPWLLQN